MLMTGAKERRVVVLTCVWLTGVVALAVGGGVVGMRSRVVADQLGAFEAAPAPTLAQRFTTLNAAIDRGDAGTAAHAWRDAYVEALRTRRWEAMLDVGDAAVRIDTLTRRPRQPTRFIAEARQAYLSALFRARDARDSEGLQRVGQAFARLGDREMAARARVLAETP
jgi:hypothetical protein